MSQLIVDTPDKHDEVLNLLKETGIPVEDDDMIENVFQVPDSSIAKVEEILAANSIEFQWGFEEDDDEEYEDDYFEEDEEDA